MSQVLSACIILGFQAIFWNWILGGRLFGFVTDFLDMPAERFYRVLLLIVALGIFVWLVK